MSVKMTIRIILYPIIEIKNIAFRVVIFWPTTPFGYWLRKNMYARQLRSLGRNPVFESGVRFGMPKMIDIGINCILGRNVTINAGDCFGVYIGDNVAIADGTYLRSANHRFDRFDIPIQQQGHFAIALDYNGNKYSVVIEDDVWIGARAIILSGAKIGKGSIISAGAVVSSEIPTYSIVVGNPGRVIANRIKKYKEI